MKNDDVERPPSYESSTGGGGSGPWFQFQREYITTIPGILKIAQIVISLITFICAVVDGYGGSGWVAFVAISACICTVIYFCLYLFNTYQKVPGPWTLVEFIYYCVYTAFFFISGCVAAAKGGDVDSAAASAFFSFLAMVVYGVDCFFKFKVLRGQQAAAGVGRPGATTVTTTQTTTTVERVDTY